MGTFHVGEASTSNLVFNLRHGVNRVPDGIHFDFAAIGANQIKRGAQTLSFSHLYRFGHFLKLGINVLLQFAELLRLNEITFGSFGNFSKLALNSPARAPVRPKITIFARQKITSLASLRILELRK